MNCKRILAVLAIALSVSTVVDAQNALGRIANRAKKAAENAVGSKVENVISSAVNKALGNPQNSNSGDAAASHSSYYGETDSYIVYVDGLVSTVESGVGFPDLGDVQSKSFESISDAVKACPKLPTAAQIVSKDPAPARAIMEFAGTASRMMGNYSISSIDAYKRDAGASSKNNVSAAQMAQTRGTAMEMFRLMEKHGVDPEKMSEAELMEFTKKMVASGELKLPAGVSAADLVSEDDSADDKLGAKINELTEVVNRIVINNSMMAGVISGKNPIDHAANQIKASWKGSDAYKKVYEIEKDIDGKLDEYFRKHSSNGAIIDYPSFWVDGRKKENAIINDFNKASAGKWVKALQTELDKYLPLLDEIAKLDAEIDALYPDRKSSENLGHKNSLSQAFMSVSTLIEDILEKAYAMPYIENVAESNKMAM